MVVNEGKINKLDVQCNCLCQVIFRI